MVPRPPPAEGERVVLVRLSDVPVARRRLVARRLVRVEGLVGERALEMLLAAESPTQDPSLAVTARLARLVLR